MIEEKQLNPPQDIAATVAKEARRIESFLKARKLNYGEEKVAKIERDLARKLDAWKKQTAPLKAKLVRWNDMIEGVVEDTNFPFEGASNITLHYAAGVQGIFKSTFNRTIYQDPAMFVARGEIEATDEELQAVDSTLGPEAVKASLKERVEQGMNHTFSELSNGLRTMKGGTNVCFRDGTLIIAGSWERRVERGNDARTYTDAESFQEDYPDALAAGVSEEEYGAILDKWLTEPEFEFRASFDYDFVAYDGPEYDIVPLAHFVFYPVVSPTIKRMEMYGKGFYLTLDEIKIKAKRGEFYPNAAERIEKAGQKQQNDSWSASRNYIEGLAAKSEENKPTECYRLVYKADLDGDGIPEKYILTYALEHKVLLSMEKYPIRRNIDFCVDFRFLRRDGRFLGVSLVGDTEDLFLMMDTIHRHRNNVRTLVTSPIFLADDKYKETIDLGRGENVFRPGMTLWVKDIDKSIKQMELVNLTRDADNRDEEDLLNRYIELRIGASQGLSGQDSPTDPDAPMGKTLALLNQANQRIDDYADEFKESFPALGELHAALWYQFGPEMVKFTVDKDGKPTPTAVPRELFAAKGISWDLKRRSVTLSPEFSMQRLSGLMQVYANLMPLMMAGDTQAIEMWNRTVRVSGEPDSEKLLRSAQLLLPPMPPGMPGAAPIPGMTAGKTPAIPQNGGVPVGR